MGKLKKKKKAKQDVKQAQKKWRRTRKRAKKGSSLREKANEKLDKLSKKLKKLIRQIKQLRKKKTKSGKGPWQGTQSIVENEIIPIMKKYGPITSTKRTETYGNPGSDHHTSQTNAYAADCGIADRHDVLDQIARAVVGRPVNDYENVYFYRAGKRFRFQGIAGTHGTGPHLHIGIRRS